MRAMKSPSGSRANVWFVEALNVNQGGSLNVSDAVTCSAAPDQYVPVPRPKLPDSVRRAAVTALYRKRVNRYSPGGRNTPGAISNVSKSRSYVGFTSITEWTLSPDWKCQSSHVIYRSRLSTRLFSRLVNC